MSDQKQLTIVANEIPPEAPQTLAMVYRNEFNEVSHVSSGNSSIEVDGGLVNIAFVFVLSLLALVTISRRPSKKS